MAWMNFLIHCANLYCFASLSPLKAAEQNEINPDHEEKLSEALAEFFSSLD